MDPELLKRFVKMEVTVMQLEEAVAMLTGSSDDTEPLHKRGDEPPAQAGRHVLVAEARRKSSSGGAMTVVTQLKGRLESVESILEVLKNNMPDPNAPPPEPAVAPAAETSPVEKQTEPQQPLVIPEVDTLRTRVEELAAELLQVKETIPDTSAVQQPQASGPQPPDPKTTQMLTVLRAQVEGLEEALQEMKQTLPDPLAEAVERQEIQIQASLDSEDAAAKAAEAAAEAAAAAAALPELSASMDQVKHMVEASQQDLNTRFEELQAKQDKLQTQFNNSKDGPEIGLHLEDMQAELERLRKLFEFIQGVLPKEHAEAMSFFMKSRTGSKENAKAGPAAALGADVDFEQHKAKLGEELQQARDDFKRELDNMMFAVKGLQKETEKDRSKVEDVVQKMAMLAAITHGSPGSVPESQDGSPTSTSGKVFVTTDMGADGEFADSKAGDAADIPEGEMPKAPSTAPADMKQGKSAKRVQLSHLLDPQGNQLPFVSKQSLQKAIDGLRDDVRSWLDVLHGSMVTALERKADNEALIAAMPNLSNSDKTAMVAAAHQDMAMFAKRSLTGRCASCNTPFSLNESVVQKPSLVSGGQGQWPARGSLGASTAIRPPEPHKIMPPPPQSRLPKIQDPSISKNFPKGKVLRNSSVPDLRQQGMVPQDQ